MESTLPLLIPVLLGLQLIRLLAMPIKLIYKAGIHAIFGFACLWLLNTVSGFTGLYLPINAITVLLAGTLGVPGLGIIALLAVL